MHPGFPQLYTRDKLYIYQEIICELRICPVSRVGECQDQLWPGVMTINDSYPQSERKGKTGVLRAF